MIPQVIWKEVLGRSPSGYTRKIPEGAVFLSVQTQHDQVVVWFRCDSTAPKQTRGFILVETGMLIPSTATYLGTCILPQAYVLHVFLEDEG